MEVTEDRVVTGVTAMVTSVGRVQQVHNKQDLLLLAVCLDNLTVIGTL